jgi:hypothetical protein
MTHRYLHEKVAVVLKAGGESQTIDSADSDNADELVRILDQVEADSRDVTRNPRLEVRRLQLDMPLLDLGCVPPVRITSLGASGGRVLQYEATLDQCFDTAGGFLTEKLPNVNHNMISGGLLIEYGKARIVLGGDIDREAWEETLRRFPSQRLCSGLVKASHHGSVTGYCNNLWQELSPGQTAIAVITPYSSQGLPSAEGAAHISNKREANPHSERGRDRPGNRLEQQGLGHQFSRRICRCAGNTARSVSKGLKSSSEVGRPVLVRRG